MSGKSSPRSSLLPVAFLLPALLAGQARAQGAPLPSIQETLKTARAEAKQMPSVSMAAERKSCKDAPPSAEANLRKALADIKALPSPQWNVNDRVRATYYRADDLDAAIDLLLPRILELVQSGNPSAARALIEAIGKSSTVYTPTTGIPWTPRVRYKPDVDARLALAGSYID